MSGITRVLSVSFLTFLAVGTEPGAIARALQEAPPAQNPSAAQSTGSGQGRGGERRPGLFGKLTAVHDQSIEITRQDGSVVTVKISANTQFRKEREAAKLGDFKVGDTVIVRGAENADHTWT